MSDRKVDLLEWVESHNGFDFNCKLQIAKHEGNHKKIFLIIPGVDGSLDGYENKYLQIARNVNREFRHTAYQMDYPYISRLHFQSNVRQILDYIYMKYPEVESIDIMAHSAGAWVIGNIAGGYPEIKKLLLVNPATNVDLDKFENAIEQNKHSEIIFLIGSEDPSHEHKARFQKDNTKVIVVDGADHHFSGDHLPHFISAPTKYLY